MTRTTLLMTAVSALGLVLASGGAMAQANGQAEAKSRQIVVEAKADEKKAEAPAEAPKAEEKVEEKAAEAPKAEEKAEAKAEEAPAKDTATLTDAEKAEVAKAIEDVNAKDAVKKEEPAVKVVEEPAPVVKKIEKKITSKVVIVEKGGVLVKIRKYSNGKYKILGYVHDYGYQEPSYSYGYEGYNNYGGYNSYGYGSGY